MSSEYHSKFSLIIPCYNESANIENLFDGIKEIQKELNFEVIIINNGSTDNSNLIIERNKNKINNLNLISIKDNIGFGYAVKKGIKESKSNIVCYTHGDLQIDLRYCIDAFKIFEKSQTGNVFVKSVRKNRSYLEIFFSMMMGLFNSILFRKIFYEIHAHPNLFRKLKDEIIDQLKYINKWDAKFVLPIPKLEII